MYLQLIYTNPQTARLSCNPLIKQPGWSLLLPRLISLSRLKRIGTNKEHKQGSDSQFFKGLGDSNGDQLLSPLLSELFLSPHPFFLGPARTVLFSAGAQTNLVGLESFGRLRTITAEKAKRKTYLAVLIYLWLQERAAGAAIQLKRGAEGEANAGNNSWRLTARSNLGQKFVSACGLWWSLLFLGGLP